MRAFCIRFGFVKIRSTNARVFVSNANMSTRHCAAVCFSTFSGPLRISIIIIRVNDNSERLIHAILLPNEREEFTDAICSFVSEIFEKMKRTNSI